MASGAVKLALIKVQKGGKKGDDMAELEKAIKNDESLEKDAE